MRGLKYPIALWQESDGAWSAGAYAFDACFSNSDRQSPDDGSGVEFDRAVFRWACSGFATETAARAGYGLHHPHPGDHECVIARRSGARELQAAMAACAYRFRLDPASGGPQPVPTGSRCTWCEAVGTAYEYHGRAYDGMTAYRGERLCPACRDARMASEGVDILVRPDGPWREPFVVNTVADRDKITLWLPPELRGVDGRDLHRLRRRRSQNRSAQSRTRARPADEDAG
jgi:hypothetical protein